MLADLGAQMLNVLIVEDDLTIAELLQETLEADGYHVTGIARTVSEALKLAKQTEPDIAVVDIGLANGDSGTDVGRYLRQETSTRVLFSTGNSSDLSMMNACGDAVMTKPYRLTDVGRGLEIIDELARLGRTRLPLPPNFRLLAPAILQTEISGNA